MDDIVKIKNHIRNLFIKATGVDKEKLVSSCIAIAFLKDLSEDVKVGSDLTIPAEARWDQLVKTKFDIGGALCNAFKALETANENSKGLFGSFCEDFSFISENTKLESMFFSLLQDISFIPYSTDKMFDLMLYRIMNDIKTGVGTSLVPEGITKLMVSLLGPLDNKTLCDPFCGRGELLVQSEKYLQAKNPDAKLKLFGQESDRYMWRIAQLNLILHGHPESRISQSDAITYPMTCGEKNELCTFDSVISIPPFGKHEWGYKVASDDPFGRFRYGLPPKMASDFAYIQHMIASLNENGKMVVAVASSSLFRYGAEEKIRAKIINSDLIEAIIQLPSRVFKYTSIPICLFIMSLDKPSGREENVLFISADDEFQNNRSIALLQEDGIEKILSAYQRFENIDNYSRVVRISEIAANNYNLTVSLYVDKSLKTKAIDVSKSLAEIQALIERREELISDMKASLQKLGRFR